MLRTLSALCLAFWITSTLAIANEPKKIVLIAGKKSHGPEGNGIHDYPWSVKLLKVMLDNSNVADKVKVEYHLEGFPKDAKTLDDADSILIVSDGRDGDLYEEAPHFASPENLTLIQRQVQRGCGFAVIHFSTFGPDKYAPHSFEWTGGYFDWEEDGKRKWYSAIETRDAEVTLAAPEHPIVRGVKPFRLNEEFYFNIRFAPDDKTVTPLWQVADLPGREDRGKVVAWAKQRPGGGRGFGTTCGHFYTNWEREEFRTLVLNALVWTAGIDPPKEGVKAKYYSRNEISASLSGVQGTERAIAKEKPIRVLLLAGNEAHEWHNWKKTTPVIKAAIEVDPRIKVDVSNDPEIFATDAMSKYDVIVQNYANWHDNKPLSDKARVGFADFIAKGKGLLLIHFANGAWNFSLPMAGESDWPEYRKIVRRVWNHAGTGEAKSGHDAFGRIQVSPTKLAHEITSGIGPFEIEDELYYRQDGSEPVEPLITAHSKDTKRDEGLAWTYRYGDGRVFQTLLGHSEKTYEAFGPREMLRRAVAWCVNEPVLQLDEKIESQLLPPKAPEAPKAAAAPVSKERLVEGRFGKGLNGASGGALAPPDAELRDAPLTIDCWVKLENKDGFNILVASEEKASPSHWELYTYAGSGVLSAYLPARGGEFKTDKPIVDGKWHYVAMQLDRDKITLYVDGVKSHESPLKGGFAGSKPGNVAVGRLVEGGIGCEGVIDDLHFRCGIVAVEKPSSEPAKADAATLLLWNFDELADGKLQDSSPAKKNEFTAAPAAADTKKSADTSQPKEGHWSHKGVGFAWQESDSADDRWKHTNHGRHLASILPLASGTIAKGLTLRLGPKMEMTVAYDTQTVSLRAAWTGGFLKFDPARYGIIAAPRPEGEMKMEWPADLGWSTSATPELPVSNVSFNVIGEQAQLEYRVGNSVIRETPWATQSDNGSIGLIRELEIAPQDAPLTLWLADNATARNTTGKAEIRSELKGRPDIQILVTGDGIELARATKNGREVLGIVIPARKAKQQLQIAFGFGAIPSLTKQTESFSVPKSIYTTKGARSPDTAALVLDRIPLPFENADKALFFVTGHDFLAPGKMAVSTLHGDIWFVDGIDDDLNEITWTRFATGLFQPLGLKVRDGQIYVLGRDQITRLVDADSDGVADRYECFCNLWDTPTGGHDYATCLEMDSKGNFYFLDAVKGVQKVSADGSKVETVATGLRNPNGMGMSPRDEITAAPQEGEWTPASFVAYANPGNHFGYQGPKVAPERPLGFDKPLLYLSRRIDNSCGGQVWVPKNAFGPLSEKMLHLSFGQCRMLLIQEETVNGIRQAGATSLPFDFDSGIMRGRFSPFDGSLYVSGSRGWVTRAAQDGCLTRVRYTGKPFTEAPTKVESRGNGFVFQFDTPLDRQTAVDPGSYHMETWNYHYSAGYGSRDYKVSNDAEEGRDEIEVLSATLSEDGKSLSLRTSPLQPANQVFIEYRLRTSDGKPLKQTYLHTLHAVRSEMLPEASTHNALAAAGLNKVTVAKLEPGLLWNFAPVQEPFEAEVWRRKGKAPEGDFVSRRMAAISVNSGEPPSAFLQPGPFTATASGFLIAPFSDEYAFELQGEGKVTLEAAGKMVFSGAITNDMPQRLENIRLNKGHNGIKITLASSSEGTARLRVLWKGEGFPWEPLPPTALVHLPSISAEVDREGLLLFAERNCIACHPSVVSDKSTQTLLQKWFAAPRLTEIASRLNPDWISSWIANPRSHRSNARMPHLLAEGEQGKSDAADLAAYLLSQSKSAPVAQPLTDAASQVGGRLYETLGCVSCHQLTPSSQVDSHDRISLHFVAKKFTAAGLVAFIKNPTAHAPASRMPDFALTDDEATQLASYLQSQTAANELPQVELPAGNAQRGKERYEKLRCANCHEDTRSDRVDIAIDKSGGCLSAKADRSVNYELSQGQKNILYEWLHMTAKQTNLNSQIETASLLMKQYRCNACHDRDLAVAPRRALIEEEGDSGLPAPVIPNLTWTGDKLRRDWLQPFLAGESKVPTRPWLAARMPRFPAIAEPLAKGFAAEHGQLALEPSSAVHFDKEKAQLGASLASQNHLDCRQCHAIGSLQPRGDDKSQIALGINFALTRDRLHHDFFERFVLDPARYDIGTKMPKLAEEGRTRATGILDGDAKAQFDALWQFIRSIPDKPTN